MKKEKVVQGTLFPEFERKLQESLQQSKEAKKKSKQQSQQRLLQEKQDKIEELKAELVAKQKEIEQLQKANQKLTVKAEAFDELIESRSLFTTSVIAKSFGYSAVWLNEFLNKKKVQYFNGETWLLYAKYDKCGYTRICWYNYSTDSKGNPLSKAHSYWTAKGMLFIKKLLQADGLIKD